MTLASRDRDPGFQGICFYACLWARNTYQLGYFQYFFWHITIGCQGIVSYINRTFVSKGCFLSIHQPGLSRILVYVPQVSGLLFLYVHQPLHDPKLYVHWLPRCVIYIHQPLHDKSITLVSREFYVLIDHSTRLYRKCRKQMHKAQLPQEILFRWCGTSAPGLAVATIRTLDPGFEVCNKILIWSLRLTTKYRYRSPYMCIRTLISIFVYNGKYYICKYVYIYIYIKCVCVVCK